MAYVRRFRTGSGATGVQVCWKEQGRVVRTVHVGSANSDVALKKLLREAQGIMNEGKQVLFDLDDYEEDTV